MAARESSKIGGGGSGNKRASQTIHPRITTTEQESMGLYSQFNNGWEGKLDKKGHVFTG